MVNQSWAFHDRHFSSARLQHYLAAAGGDEAEAVALYRWNLEIAGAFWESLGHFEVALRNTIDTRLSERHARLGRPGHWIFDDAHELGKDKKGPGSHAYPYVDIKTAINRVRTNRKPVHPGQVISEVPFGFWHQMISKSQTALWPDLASGFPHAPRRAQGLIHDPVKRLRELRNRIGHHHRIWSIDLASRYSDLCEVAGYIDPHLRVWIDTESRVTSLLSARP